ncbi:hypothetical protein AAHA92_03854 [Salvia divinorum]|uniref:SKP1-like protein n=1 Tax=Salvia divinorum TaxID=28513 RepID=A0ABD1HZU4_SALDI
MVSASENSGKKIILRSSDGEVFEVDEAVATKSQIIKYIFEDVGVDDVIPIPNVTGKILSKVIEYCKKHVDPAASSASTEAFDADFVKVDRDTLFHLISAADYLNIKSLLDLTYQTVDDMIKGKTPEEITKTFNIKKIILRSSDGEKFEVDEAVAAMSQIIEHTIKDCVDNVIPIPDDTGQILSMVIEYCKKHIIEDVGVDDVIPIPNVTGKILSKVIEYCKKHVDAAASSASTEAFDADFVKVDQATLFDLILAANYLDIESLLDLTCQAVADMIKGKTPEEIRKAFNMNDFTPEEEEEIRRENQWAFE